MSKNCRFTLFATLLLSILIANCGKDPLGPETEISFPDTVLGTVVCAALERDYGPVTLAELLTLDTLHYYGGGVKNLQGLQYCTNLTSLQLPWGSIEDITPLFTLRKLEKLNLWDNRISSVKPLMLLMRLRHLDLGENEIRDISGINAALSLEWLNLSANPVSDIRTLGNMTRLRDLHLNLCNIVNIDPLSKLTNVRFLALESNSVADLRPLVDNLGLNDGDTVHLHFNPLSEESISVYIPELQARGVYVTY
ncbi:MAG: leucine-rich repeat domain-containing protein [Candidatus Zixiibacteriota bacterium]|nr:MAG: leucine-rich repeat domain-containing protein [candidate division Zixibacteria bacterium]